MVPDGEDLMLRVITVNNRPDLYGPIYDDMIAMGIKKHLSLPHEHLHISAEKGDSWIYVELFKLEPFLFVGIDTIIVGSLDECCNMGHFTAIREWKPPNSTEPNTSLMWVEGVKHLADIPIDKEKYTWGNHAEQRFLQHNARINFYPSKWTPSYKYSTVTDDAKIVIFHGKPKPHEVGWEV